MRTSAYFIYFMAWFVCIQVHAQYQASAPLIYSGQSNILIENKAFTSGSSGVAIKLTNCSNVTIRNCSFTNIPTVVAIQLQSCSNVEISNCTFDTFRSGVYAISSTGIDVHCNSFKDIVGPKPRGQIVQFNACYGAGNRVSYNILEHTFGSGDPEDLINMYASSGTTADPLQIIGNKLRGGGPSASGGGIMVGDNDGHDIIVADNILVDPGQYGIGCPAGYNITIRNNKVFGKQQSFTNVGIYVGLQSEIDAGHPCVANTIKVQNNQVNWKRKDGINNSFWNCGCCAGIVQSGNVWNSSSINANILPATLSLNTTMCGAAPQITSLKLIDVSTGMTISGFENMETITEINKSLLDVQNFNIYAEVSSTVDSVVFSHTHDGTTLRRKEGVAPYALRGDGSGYQTWTLPAGVHEISITAYSGGLASETKELVFSVNDGTVTAFGDNNVTAQQFYMYPNPTTHQITIHYPLDLEGDLTITNVLNQKIMVKQIDARATQIDINVSTLEKGTYFINISNRVLQFMKQ